MPPDTDGALQEREIAVKEREQATREGELALKRLEQATSGWRSPLVVAVFAAAVGALGNAVVSYVNGALQRDLDAQRSEQARLLEMIKTGDPDKAANNLKFLLDAGLVNDARQASRLRDFLASRQPGSGPALPSAGSLSPGIVGLDDAMPTSRLAAQSPLRRAADAVGQLRAVDSQVGGSTFCTAFLIAPRLILTAGHCADGIKEGVFALNASESEATYTVELPAVETRSDSDGLSYTILRLMREVRSVAPLALSTQAPALADGAALIMFRGARQQLIVSSVQDCRVVSVESEQFHHLCDSGAGSSGAPILSSNATTVLGIHVGRDQRGGVATRADRVRASAHLALVP